MACAACGADVSIHQFPAALRTAAGGEERPAGASLPEEGGRCYSHPGEVAEAVCDSCGRFLCRNCDTEWDGEHLCLTCIHDRREVKREAGFVSKRLVYDNVALALLAVPVVFFYPLFWLAIFTAPLAMYYLVRHRKEPPGFVPRGPFRMILGWILCGLFVVGSLSLFGLIAFMIFEGLTTLEATE